MLYGILIYSAVGYVIEPENINIKNEIPVTGW
jgi:hypothetical protein